MKNYFYCTVLLLFITIAKAQQPNDCVNAITICGNGVFTSNASGIGTIQEVDGCGGFEHNSIWLKVIVAQGGTLGFDLIPLDVNINVDYDFWVYGPNTSCSNLGAPIRCCTTNPELAGLANNLTGLHGSSLVTSSGPGANGNGYVRWLNVDAGQTYYIAIDRPVGDGGFELHWTGSAVLTAAPTANTIVDFVTFSMTPDIGLFNLDAKRSEINSDLITNSIDFFTTLANAVDNVSALPDIITNTSNPQPIYARVTNVITGCFSIVQFNLVVSSVLGIDPALTTAYEVTAYPNPFENDFVIDVATTNQGMLKVKVYDTLGKLVEESIVNSNKVSSQKMGQKYPAGIYTISVQQDEAVVKTLQVIKK